MTYLIALIIVFDLAGVALGYIWGRIDGDTACFKKFRGAGEKLCHCPDDPSLHYHSKPPQ